jgi:hypothetical protein
LPLFEKQKEFVKALKNPKLRYLLYGGGMSGGKSILQVGIIHRLACEYPGTKYAIIRKNFTILKRTSVPTYEKILEINEHTDMAKQNQTDYTAKYSNGSKILFIEADTSKDPRLLKLSGLEITCALIEEANECEELAFQILKTRVGRWKNKEYGIPPIILLNCNPDKNWVKELFYDEWVNNQLKPPYYFLQALAKDNPHNTKEYIEGLESLPESEKQRLLFGNWEYSNDPNQLIQYGWLKEGFIDKEDTLQKLTENNINKFNVWIGVDAAREGDDNTVFAYFVGNKLCRLEVMDSDDLEAQAELLHTRMLEYNVHHHNVAVDATGGWGCGILDAIKKNYKKKIYAYKGGAKPEDKPNDIHEYKNTRAKAHWDLREDIRLGRIETMNHKRFVKEATNIHYEIDDKHIKMESKQGFKKRIKCSPDVLDAVVIANFIRRRIPGEFNKIKVVKRRAFNDLDF